MSANDKIPFIVEHEINYAAFYNLPGGWHRVHHDTESRMVFEIADEERSVAVFCSGMQSGTSDVVLVVSHVDSPTRMLSIPSIRL